MPDALRIQGLRYHALMNARCAWFRRGVRIVTKTSRFCQELSHRGRRGAPLGGVHPAVARGLIVAG